METMKTLFVVCVILTIYSYLLYPLVLVAVGRIVEKRVRQADWRPAVTLVISAYNEEAVILRKLENSLGLDYPKDLLEVMVVSDKSDDRTDEIVRSYGDKGVVLLAQPERHGKTAGLNRAVSAARGTIIVFSDADAMYDRDAIKKIVNYLGDESVGLVTGSTKYTSGSEGDLVETSGLYTKLERFIKRHESRSGSCVGADGAIFGMKKSLYEPLKADDINDFVIPLNVVRQGRRVVLHEGAFCMEDASSNSERESRRQARITNRTLRALFRNADLMNPLRYPGFALQLISHKLIRLSVPIFLAVLIPLNVLLAPQAPAYVVTLVCQAMFYAAALIGRKGDLAGRGGWSRVAYHFVVVNVSILIGWYKFLAGEKHATWTVRQ